MSAPDATPVRVVPDDMGGVKAYVVDVEGYDYAFHVDAFGKLVPFDPETEQEQRTNNYDYAQWLVAEYVAERELSD